MWGSGKVRPLHLIVKLLRGAPALTFCHDAEVTHNSDGKFWVGVNVMVTRDSGTERKSLYVGGRERAGMSLPAAGDHDSDQERERRSRAEASKVRRQESYNADSWDGENRASDGVEKRYEEELGGGMMDENRRADERKEEDMIRTDEEEEKNDGANGQDKRQGGKSREDKTHAEEEMVPEVKNPELHRVEDEGKESQRRDSSVIETIARLNPSLRLSIETDAPNSEERNSSTSHQSLDPLRAPPSPTDSRAVTPAVSHTSMAAGGSEEVTFTSEKTNSELVQLRTLTDYSLPHLREEEGLVPRATEKKFGPSGASTSLSSGTREQRSEKKRTKLKRPVPKTKKKKTHPASDPETKRSKPPKKVKAEQKSKSQKKGKNEKNKKKTKHMDDKTEKENINFPYFKDDYCPPDCACYGRVVQCSDKGVDKIPYGIPYNARYILLMNNNISGIQLDLLREYLTLEFLVLSNNRLTDGGIEGAFEGMSQLKRLYLDGNRLMSIPADLPVSLEELRLDGNLVSEMSEVAWTGYSALVILSLNNNSLGGESLPERVFAPLTGLRTLSLINNRLTAAPLHLPANIKELYLRGNHIEQVPSSTFPKGSDLLVLDLSDNRLTNKGLAKDSLQTLVHLENLNLEGNLFRQIPRHLPPTIRTLNLEGNIITSVGKADFLGLPHLEHLGLSRNQITRVAPGAFWGLPVLHQLELGHNTLRQVPRRLPPSLRSVSLIHNKIRSIPRDAFCSKGKYPPLSGLVKVQLEHNLIHLGDLDSQAFSCLRGYQ
ncbi:hypothetical protein JZ751_008853, partial [Albula glossodonta]